MTSVTLIILLPFVIQAYSNELTAAKVWPLHKANLDGTTLETSGHFFNGKSLEGLGNGLRGTLGALQKAPADFQQKTLANVQRVLTDSHSREGMIQGAMSLRRKGLQAFATAGATGAAMAEAAAAMMVRNQMAVQGTSGLQLYTQSSPDVLDNSFAALIGLFMGVAVTCTVLHYRRSASTESLLSQ